MLSLLGAPPDLVKPQTAQAQAAGRSILCNVGPVQRVFGGTGWFVCSCRDGATMLLIPAPGNSAVPSYFSPQQRDGRNRVAGESRGDRTAGDGVRAALEALTPAALQALPARPAHPPPAADSTSHFESLAQQKARGSLRGPLVLRLPASGA